MKLPTDYADRSAHLVDLEDHWHKNELDELEVKIGKLAFFVSIVLIALAFSFVYSKSSPAAVNTVSCYALVDQNGEE